MPVPNGKTSYFIKDEASFPIRDGVASNYTGLGIKYSQSDIGNIEGMGAWKVSESAYGGFAELKYTTPKIAGSDWGVESRTRICADKTYNEDSLSTSLTQRISAKGSWDLGKGWSVYEIAGVNSKISLQGDGIKTITPTSITGVGYKNAYCELGLSQSYDIKTHSWKQFSPEIYVGYKITF